MQNNWHLKEWMICVLSLGTTIESVTPVFYLTFHFLFSSLHLFSSHIIHLDHSNLSLQSSQSVPHIPSPPSPLSLCSLQWRADLQETTKKDKIRQGKSLHIEAGHGNPAGWRVPEADRQVKNSPVPIVRIPTKALICKGPSKGPWRLHTYSFSLCVSLWALLYWVCMPCSSGVTNHSDSYNLPSPPLWDSLISTLWFAWLFQVTHCTCVQFMEKLM